MSTRETLRHELKELAKLGEALRQERAAQQKAGTEWSAFAAELEPGKTPEPSTPPSDAQNQPSPGRPSSVTVPPVAPSTPPAMTPAAADGSAKARRVAVATAAAAFIGAIAGVIAFATSTNPPIAATSPGAPESAVMRAAPSAMTGTVDAAADVASDARKR
jgi:hypothetical protein